MSVVLTAWPEHRVLAETNDLLVVDKPTGFVVHGGDERRGDDVVSRLRARLADTDPDPDPDTDPDTDPDPYLGVHQRLDKDASGVLAFTRRKQANAEVAKQIETHSVDRVYIAAVEPRGATELADSGTLEHHLDQVDGRARVVETGGKLCVAHYRMIARGPADQSSRALVELRPRTGRTHQLRAQLAAIGAPIAGDRLYGPSNTTAPAATRLMLHATRLGFEHLGTFESPPPLYFTQWLDAQPQSLPPIADLVTTLEEAASRRWPLRDRTTAYRLLDEQADQLPGITVDIYGDHAVLLVSSAEARERAPDFAAALLELGVQGVYLKVRFPGAKDPYPKTPIAGEPAPDELLVREDKAQFAVDLDDGLSTGFFVDQRDNRERVASLAPGARVLNLFSYTGAFTVVAARRGAKSTTSIDTSKRALERTRRNLELNGLTADKHRLLRADALDWLKRATRRDEQFDLIILDPPSFSSGKKPFTMPASYTLAAELAIRLLAPGGHLLAVSNHRKTSRAHLRKLIHTAAKSAGRATAQLKDLSPPLDCPEGHDGTEPVKSLLARF